MTSKKLVVLTGSSSGIGKALLELYLAQGHRVFHFSRSASSLSDTNQVHFQHSITDFQKLQESFATIVTQTKNEVYEEIVLINNAGQIGSAKAIQDQSSEEIKETLEVNLTGAMVCTSQFISSFNYRKEPLVIVNISSGAAQRAIHGWSAYSASKAGMDAMSKTVALELSKRVPAARVYSIYPGVVDTAMQAQIRQASKKDFPAIERFIELKNKGELSQSDIVAQKIAYIAHEAKPESGSILDVRQFDL